MEPQPTLQQTPEQDPRMPRQVELEALMRGWGTDAFRKALNKARTKGEEDSTTYGHHLLKRLVAPTSEAIKAFMEEADGPQAGERHSSVDKLVLIEPDVAAFLTVKGVLAGLTRRPRAQRVFVSIGMLVEDEVRFRHFEGERPYLWKKLQEDLNHKTSDYGRKRGYLMKVMKRAKLDPEPWSDSVRLHLGAKLVDLLIAATKLVEVKTFTVGKNRKTTILEATVETVKLVTQNIDSNELLCPSYLPTVIPPKGWSSVDNGGYFTPGVKRLKLVKVRPTLRGRAYLDELGSKPLDMVYGTVNALQNVPWKINPKVYDTITQVWAGRGGLGELPEVSDADPPAKPFDIDTNKDALIKWKIDARKHYDKVEEEKSKRVQVYNTLKIARLYRNDECFYFPHTLDFRGRVYAQPMFLNPQGPDYAKALITFANGKPIEDETSANWLAIHGSNVYGNDKVSLEERVQWVNDNEESILASAADPLGCHFWCKPEKVVDKPWQFLAFCFEWAEFKEQGYGFVSHLPIALDGSCNGLQHFSAMLRDPVGGRATNLVPSKTPQDIYQTVADKVIEILKEDKVNVSLASQWLEFGIDRDLCKRPVMVVPYGGTQFSCRDYIVDKVTKKMTGQDYCPFGDDIKPACNYLAGVVWQAIGETVVAARVAMRWLKDVARILSHVGLPVTWTAPSGFPVCQAYPETKMLRVNTKMAGSVIQLALTEEDKLKLSKSGQANGISPNFVHSLDASALMFTVNFAREFEIESFAMIHDSYGTLAADTETLRNCLRNAFCSMYQDQNVLQAFADEVKVNLPEGVELPPVPPMGTLDLTQVLQSDFFFA